MTGQNVIAVFDIGKTNKKLFLFDEDYNIVHEISTTLKETVDEDDDPCEDINLLTTWIRSSFNEVFRDPKYNIKAINFSTYGASFVHVDEQGKTVAPLYNYLKPFPDELKAKFYNEFGGETAFARTTASPVLGSLNSGMQLYFLKHRKPSTFKGIFRSLHLPQYASSLFTGRYDSDITSIGCHTNLWDFDTKNYHRWVSAEGIAPKLAPIQPSTLALKIEVESKFMYSGIGLHDSSSALIPYLRSVQEPFVLLSTGTWCISLNPFNSTPLTEEQLTQDCLCYLKYEGRPVKASRLFSGHIHEGKCRDLTMHFGVSENAYKTIASGESWLRHQLNKTSAELKRIFARSDYSVFNSFEEGYVALIRHLVDRQIESTNLIIQDNTTSIFVDGGFSQNGIYMTMLAAAYPAKKVYAASVVQASALGAAIVLNDVWNGKGVRNNILKLKEVRSQ